MEIFTFYPLLAIYLKAEFYTLDTQHLGVQWLYKDGYLTEGTPPENNAGYFAPTEKGKELVESVGLHLFRMT